VCKVPAAPAGASKTAAALMSTVAFVEGPAITALPSGPAAWTVFWGAALLGQCLGAAAVLLEPCLGARSCLDRVLRRGLAQWTVLWGAVLLGQCFGVRSCFIYLIKGFQASKPWPQSREQSFYFQESCLDT